MNAKLRRGVHLMWRVYWISQLLKASDHLAEFVARKEEIAADLRRRLDRESLEYWTESDLSFDI